MRTWFEWLRRKRLFFRLLVHQLPETLHAFQTCRQPVHQSSCMADQFCHANRESLVLERTLSCRGSTERDLQGVCSTSSRLKSNSAAGKASSLLSRSHRRCGSGDGLISDGQIQPSGPIFKIVCTPISPALPTSQLPKGSLWRRQDGRASAGAQGAAFRTNSSKSSQRRPDVTTSDRVRDRPCKALKLLICCATLGSLLRLKVGLRHRVQLPLSPRVILAGVGAMLGAESPDDKFRERLTERAFEAEVVSRGVRKRVTVDECVDVVIPPLASADTVLVATVDAPVGCHEIRHVEGRIFRPFLDEDGET